MAVEYTQSALKPTRLNTRGKNRENIYFLLILFRSMAVFRCELPPPCPHLTPLKRKKKKDANFVLES